MENANRSLGFLHHYYGTQDRFGQISKCSVLDSEAKKDCRFFQTAGKTQLPKRLIVGKDYAAGKVLAGKSVIFAFCGVVGSKGRTPPVAFYKKLVAIF